MNNIDKDDLLFGLPNTFKFIYKNIKILDFYEEPPQTQFLTLLEKEKENLVKSDNITTEYKFYWTKIIAESLFDKKKRLLKVLEIYFIV